MPQARGPVQESAGRPRSRRSPPTLMFYYGQKREAWTKVVVLHEFAHVIVHFTWGDDVDPHGPEFMGVLCALMSERFACENLPMITARAVGLRVEPYERSSRRTTAPCDDGPAPLP